MLVTAGDLYHHSEPGRPFCVRRYETSGMAVSLGQERRNTYNLEEEVAFSKEGTDVPVCDVLANWLTGHLSRSVTAECNVLLSQRALGHCHLPVSRTPGCRVFFGLGKMLSLSPHNALVYHTAEISVACPFPSLNLLSKSFVSSALTPLFCKPVY